MMAVPPELLSIMGLTVVGFIGNTIIVEMGGKILGIFWTIIISVAGAIIGLRYAWDGIKECSSIFGL